LLPLGKLLVFGGGVFAIVLGAAVVLGSGGLLGRTASELAGAELSRPGIGIRTLGLINLVLA
jgi:hypothetical protein